IVEKLYEQAIVISGDSVIESIRTIGEVEALKEKTGFYLFAVNAEIESRYGRIVKRAGEKDSVTLEEFIAQEQQEMTSIDPNKQNLAECIRRADYVLRNDGTIEELHFQLEKILQAITNK
ncbi:MAG: hypothetical protein NTV48_01640, partial [Candidatus Vogelbacteria bacterium]|nr:hypothetical protein [Candidatus Vogelbacteria bacterium]